MVCIPTDTEILGSPHANHLFQHTVTALSVFVTLTVHVREFLSLNFSGSAAGEGAFCNWAWLPRVRREVAVSLKTCSFPRRRMICGVAQRV